MNILIEIIGWTGSLLVIMAYILISSKKIQSDSLVYQFMNLFGALFLGINVFYEQAWSVLPVQITWGLVAIIALAKKYFQKKI